MWLSVIYFPSYHKTKAECLSEAFANVKIRGSYEKEKLSKVFLALTVIIIK